MSTLIIVQFLSIIMMCEPEPELRRLNCYADVQLAQMRDSVELGSWSAAWKMYLRSMFCCHDADSGAYWKRKSDTLGAFSARHPRIAGDLDEVEGICARLLNDIRTMKDFKRDKFFVQESVFLVKKWRKVCGGGD